MPNYVTVASHTTEIWPFEFREISTFVLSPPTISFELHAKVAEEIDLEMCSYGQLSEVQMLFTLTLDGVKVILTYTVIRRGLTACPTM